MPRTFGVVGAYLPGSGSLREKRKMFFMSPAMSASVASVSSVSRGQWMRDGACVRKPSISEPVWPGCE